MFYRAFESLAYGNPSCKDFLKMCLDCRFGATVQTGEFSCATKDSVNDFFGREVSLIMADIDRFSGMTSEDFTAYITDDRTKQISSLTCKVEKLRALKSKYLSFLSEIKLWVPPSMFESFKAVVLSELEQKIFSLSVELECDECSLKLLEVKGLPDQAAMVDSLKQNLANCKLEWKKALEQAEKNEESLKLFDQSLT